MKCNRLQAATEDEGREFFNFRTAQLPDLLFEITNFKKKILCVIMRWLPREVKINDALITHCSGGDSCLKVGGNGKKPTELTKAAASQQPGTVVPHTPL